MLLSSALLSLAILPIFTTTTASPPIHTTYHRDITILGAGASGIYAAVRLRSAYNARVLLEQASHTGGHVNPSYLDRLSGQPVEGLAFPSYAATGLLEGSEIAPTSGSNSKLYTKTAAWLGSDLLLNTRILEIRRPPSSCSCSPSS
ncbi:unnamed protein product [Zymoseptoria tritici ST99CH_1A5]|uniref:Amine oxidase domain-containing protein n=2 Tax=Zymoseptoria tritici TaxID=1047171 RepID=A0A2H1FXM6_ZYMTR|nr:unnamed protein product [Zymoseptoria tritici ST99CH_1E4]SMY21214.1 unnamed protein product [Zymoseptoria tritici ST99CH_1A5]